MPLPASRTDFDQRADHVLKTIIEPAIKDYGDWLVFSRAFKTFTENIPEEPNNTDHPFWEPFYKREQ